MAKADPLHPPRLSAFAIPVSKELPCDPTDGKPLQFRPNPDGKGYAIIAVAATAEAKSSEISGRASNVSFTILR
jgi:hypothetical protein